MTDAAPDRFARAKTILDTVNAEFPSHPLGWNSGRPWLELADTLAVPVVDGELDFSALADACEEYVRAYRGCDEADLSGLVDAITKALGRPAEPTVDGDHLAAENARLATEMDQINAGIRRLMLDYGFGATGPLVEVVSMFVHNLVDQVGIRDAEIERSLESRLAWAIEADRVEFFFDRILGFFNRLLEAVEGATRKPGCSVDELIEAVAGLARQRDEALELKKQAAAELDNLHAVYAKRLASRPAIPADAEELRAQLRDWATVLARGSGDIPAVDVAWKLRQIADGNNPAPAVDSDTTAKSGGDQS